MTWFDKIPDEYQEHLPGPAPSRRETLGGVAERGLEEGIEPFLAVGQGIKDSLKRVYEVAAQPIGAADPVKPKPFSEAPFEFLGSLAGYVMALPIKMVKEVIEGGERALRGAELLRGGPRGELGEWTPEQEAVESEALNLTIGAMVGGSPGAGTGVANIGRKDALKMLAKEFKVLRKGAPTEVTSMVTKRGQSYPRTVVGQGLVREQMGKSYRTATKGLRDIPQDVLDVVKEVGLAPTERTDIAGRFRPRTTRVEYQITKHLPPETIPHEMLHAMQIAKMGKRAKGVPSAVLEAHAYEFEGIFMKAVEGLPAGKRITGETFNRLYKEALRAMTKKYGTDFSKYKMGDIVSRAHLERKWKKASAEFGKMEKEFPGWELQSPSAKVGDIIDLPKGKVRYDGSWEPVGTKPRIYQYTPTEGAAKGMTFATKGQSLREIAKGALKIIKGKGKAL